MTLKDLHNVFCRYFLYEKSRTKQTVITYTYNFHEFLTYLERNSLPSTLIAFQDHTILRNFMYSLLDRGLNKKTVRQRMLSLKSFCKYLAKEDILPRNPFDRFDIPKKEKSLPNPLRHNDRERFLSFLKKKAEKSQNVRDIQAVVMIELGLKSGLRKGAMINMFWESTDLEKGFVRVLDKGQKDKDYVLVPSTIYWLKLLRRVRGCDKGHVFLSPKSKTPISKTSLHDEFKRYAEMAGLDVKAVHLHRLRHSYGTYLLEKGMDLREVQEAMNHEDISSTVTYLEVTKGTLRKKINKVFSGGK